MLYMRNKENIAMKSEMDIKRRMQDIQDRLEGNRNDEVFQIQATAWLEVLSWVLDER